MLVSKEGCGFDSRDCSCSVCWIKGSKALTHIGIVGRQLCSEAFTESGSFMTSKLICIKFKDRKCSAVTH